MSTRGTWGFVLDGKEYLTYNHSDSYPSGLGTDVLSWARQADWSKVREQVAALTLVEEQDEPTAEEIAKLGVTPRNVSTGRDWYSALRDFQGEPQATLDLGYMTDHHGDAEEWGYVFDLDAGTFKVYEDDDPEPREAYPLDALPSEEAFLERFEG